MDPLAKSVETRKKNFGKQIQIWRAFSSKRKSGSFPVYLNVYDLTPINGYAYWLGLGIYHSGIQVHDVEYAFGAHELPSTGVFAVEPRRCQGFTFRKSILIGNIDLEPREVRAFMEKLAVEYPGANYHLITRNCNHFCNDACLRLTGKPIPRWVNRLAKIGLYCNCILPLGMRMAKVRVAPDSRTMEGEKTTLTSNSNRFNSSFSSSSSGIIFPPSPAPVSSRAPAKTKRTSQSRSGFSSSSTCAVFSRSPASGCSSDSAETNRRSRRLFMYSPVSPASKSSSVSPKTSGTCSCSPSPRAFYSARLDVHCSEAERSRDTPAQEK